MRRQPQVTPAVAPLNGNATPLTTSMTVTLAAAPTLDFAGHAVPRSFSDPTAEYRAGLQSAVVIPRPHEGVIRALGRDRLDLLHRMSTNALNDLPVGEVRPTVLTTALARMVDVLWVLNRGESVLALTGVGRALAVRRWLAGYIFYNDKVKFEDASAEFTALGLYGPQAAPIAEKLCAGAGSLAPDHFCEAEGVVAVRARPLAGDGFTLLAPPTRIPDLWAAAQAAGATPAGEEAYQLLRLAAGVPEAGHEITEDYIPLEANLWSAVSFHKGCYIGQEIIARMESRGQLAKRLRQIAFEAPVKIAESVRAADGAPLGAITSSGVLPERGPLALAYLKTAYAEAGTEVWAGDGRGVVSG
jgi:aminomethyltransferase